MFERLIRSLQGNPAAYQMFQDGLMLWYAPDVIFAIAYADNGPVTWWNKYTERWKDAGEPHYFGDAPDGCAIPQRGIGYIWNARSLEPRLGYAITDEAEFSGGYKEVDDGWLLDDWIGGIIELLGDIPSFQEPVVDPASKWVWLTELDLPLNLNHVVWVGTDRLRIGSHDIVLSLPTATAAALRDYIKAQSVEIG